MNDIRFVLAMALCAAASHHAWAAEAAKPDALKEYLVNIDAGAVSAGEILGLSGSALSSAHTTKDLIAALNAASGDGGKAGFGVAFTPARSSIDALAMPMERYLSKGNVLARLWGNTTFSYAQNRNTLAGIDYRQDAIAIHAVYYIDDESDPIVASHAAFKAEACRTDAAPELLLQAVKDESERLGRPLVQAERDALRLRLKQQKPIRDALVKDADKQAACIKEAVKKAAARWNASQLTLTVGQGWIRSPAAGAPRLSLARHVSLAGAWGPNDDSLLNLTLRRVEKEIDLDTVAGTPAYKSTTLAALRYTVGFGAEKDFYAIAEVSNVNRRRNTLANGAFKFALGADKKIGENMWLEFRLGRSRTASGSAEQTGAMLNLKLAPSSGVATLGR